MLHSITQLKGTINTCLVNCSKWRVLYARITSPCIQQTFFSIEKCKIVSPFYSTQLVSQIVLRFLRRFRLSRSSPLASFPSYLLFLHSMDPPISNQNLISYTRQSTLDRRFFPARRIRAFPFSIEIIRKNQVRDWRKIVCLFYSFRPLRGSKKGEEERKRHVQVRRRGILNFGQPRNIYLYV